MEIIKLSFEVVAPILCFLVLGYVLKCIKILTETGVTNVNKLIYSVFLPILLFVTLYQANKEEVFDFKLILFCLIALILITVSLILLVPRFIKDNKQCGAIVHGLARSNFIIFGIAIAPSLFGESAMGSMSMLIVVTVPVYAAVSVIILELFRGTKVNAKKIICGIMTNPLIWAAALGIVFLLTGLKLFETVEASLISVSGITTPLAFIVLGGSLNFGETKKYLKHISAVAVGKLIVIPAIVLSVAVLIGFRAHDLGMIMVMFSAPSAVASYAMAQEMDSDYKLAGEIVVFTTVFSVITVFLWIVFLKTMGLM